MTSTPLNLGFNYNGKEYNFTLAENKSDPDNIQGYSISSTAMSPSELQEVKEILKNIPLSEIKNSKDLNGKVYLYKIRSRSKDYTL